jgi:protein ImuB
MRVACLLVPDLPLAAEVRAHPELQGRPLVVAAGPEPRAELVAVSPAAARMGIRPGHSAAQARAACGELAVRVASPALERAARAALLDAALSLTPRARQVPRSGGIFAAEAAVWADASGVCALHASEAGFAGALAERARRLGLPGVVGLAGSQELAHLAARALACERTGGAADGEVQVLAAGREAAWLAPRPLDLLDLDPALATRLNRFGVRRLGDLARLPRASLATRLGPGALPLLDLARGVGRAVPLPANAPDRIEEAQDLEHAIESLEPLAFVLRGMLSRMAERLEVRGLGCGDIALELALDDGRRDARRVGVAAATCDARVLLRLVGLSLEAQPPPAPVEAIALSAQGRPLRRDQLDLFRPAGPSPAVLDRTLAELESLCGDGRVGAPAPQDSHRPDAFGVTPFAPGRGTHEGNGLHPPSPSTVHPTLALRILRPPVEARVRLRGGLPAHVESSAVRGDVVSCAGPWRTSGGWWSPEGRFALDHYDVQTDDGTLARLRFDGVRERWSVDALYD